MFSLLYAFIIAYLKYSLVEVFWLVCKYVVTCTVDDLGGIKKKTVTVESLRENSAINGIKLTMIFMCKSGLISWMAFPDWPSMLERDP